MHHYRLVWSSLSPFFCAYMYLLIGERDRWWICLFGRWMGVYINRVYIYNIFFLSFSEFGQGMIETGEERLAAGVSWVSLQIQIAFEGFKEPLFEHKETVLSVHDLQWWLPVIHTNDWSSPSARIHYTSGPSKSILRISETTPNSGLGVPGGGHKMCGRVLEARTQPTRAKVFPVSYVATTSLGTFLI